DQERRRDPARPRDRRGPEVEADPRRWHCHAHGDAEGRADRALLQRRFPQAARDGPQAHRRLSSGIPCAPRERCPSGLRSATGNRVRAERCVAGSNPALSAEKARPPRAFFRLVSMLSEVRTFGRFAVGLPSFLSRTLTPDECRAIVRRELARREQNFLDVLERGVFGYPASPYLPLMRNAGVELEDLRRLAADEGVEGTLGALYDAGVYLSYEEFKGNRAVERPGFTARFGHDDFDNPLLSAAFTFGDRGSRGAPRRMLLDLDFLKQEAVYHSLFFE